MTDRELLEAAAKAAGLQECGWMGDTYCHVVNNTWATFSPLTDDGDALRLAVKLRIDVRPNSYDTMCYGPDHKRHRTVAETHGKDPYAATRRAIVRAAAQIGAGMIDDSTAVHP